VAEVQGDDIRIHEVIAFKHDSADIQPKSRNVIAAVAELMNAHEEINFVEVAGHASKSGDAYYNRALTQRRANAVMAALVEEGVDPYRLRAVGYGFYCELDSNNPDVNRRVEFKVMRRGGKRTKYTYTGGGCEGATDKGIKPQPIPDTAPR